MAISFSHPLTGNGEWIRVRQKIGGLSHSGERNSKSCILSEHISAHHVPKGDYDRHV